MSADTAVVRPTRAQLAWQRLGLGLMVHFGLNTFHGKEWSDGTLPASSFDPEALDAREWVDLAVELGAKYLVLTAKHHDGFCLWPTATTDYSVASSPWRDGRGDVVAEVAAACADAGVGLGLYLSPWDRHDPRYPDPAAYADVYVQQLTELCTGYGPLVEVWFDGAGSEGYQYDWQRFMQVVHRHQPDAMVFNMGDPTIRWVGNEDGLASDPVEYVVHHTQMSNYTVVTTEFAEALYLPPECDVSVRRGWFWKEQDAPKSLEHLQAIWYRSVGLGANLLLNVPPDTRGRIDPADAAVVRALGASLRADFGQPVTVPLVRTGPTTWRGDLGAGADLDHVVLHEQLDGGQRVRRHTVALDGRVVAGAGTVGATRVHLVPRTAARVLEVEVDDPDAALAAAEVHLTGRDRLPEVPAGYVAPTDYPED